MPSRSEFYAAGVANDWYCVLVVGLTLAALVLLIKARRWRLRLPESALWFVLLVALAVRIPGLFQSFWYDETFTAALARLSWHDLGIVILSDLHPPLPYLLFHVTGRLLGWSELALRLPSLVTGLIAVWLMYRVTLESLHHERAAKIAALIMALLPMSVYYSNEARGYSLLVCLVLLMVLAVLDNRPAWFVFGSLAAYTHAYGALYVLVIGLAALVYSRRRSAYWRRWWLLSVSIGGALVLAWLPFMVYQSRDISNGFWMRPFSWPGVVWYPVTTTVGGNMPAWLGLVSIVVVTAVTTLALARRPWRYSRPALLLGVWLAVPIAAALVSALWSNIFLARALLPAGVILIVFWSWYLVNGPYRRAAGVALAAVLIAGVLAYWATPRENVRDYLAQCEGANSTYALDNHIGIIALYYSPVPVLVWSEANDTTQELSEEAKRILFDLGTIDQLTGLICIPYLDNHMASLEKIKQLAAILEAPYLEKRPEDTQHRYYRYIMFEVLADDL